MSEIHEAVEQVLTDRMSEYFGPGSYTGDSWRLSPPRLSDVVLEIIAEHLMRLAVMYPADIFPPKDDRRDAIAGTALREILTPLS
jgi:hypothetical protein